MLKITGKTPTSRIFNVFMEGTQQEQEERAAGAGLKALSGLMLSNTTSTNRFIIKCNSPALCQERVMVDSQIMNSPKPFGLARWPIVVHMIRMIINEYEAAVDISQPLAPKGRLKYPMRNICYGMILSLLCVVAATPGNGQTIHSNITAGLREMQNTGKPGMVYYFSMRTRHCFEMEQHTFTDPDVRELMSRFVVIALEVESHPATAETHGVLKVPAVILLDSQGRLLDRVIGFKTADSFVTYLETALRTVGDGRPTSGGLQQFAIDLFTPRPGTIPIPFEILMPRAQRLYLVGDFNDWRTDATPMTRQPGGRHHATLHLEPGIYEYKFLDENGEYHTDPSNPHQRPNYVGTLNSFMIVGDVRHSPELAPGMVTFYVYRPEASSVAVAGTFNDWEPFEMFRNPARPGEWGVRYKVQPGHHEYKYVIDGEWYIDPENFSPVVDPQGFWNSSFESM